MSVRVFLPGSSTLLIAPSPENTPIRPDVGSNPGQRPGRRPGSGQLLRRHLVFDENPVNATGHSPCAGTPYSPINSPVNVGPCVIPPGTRRCCDVESTSLTLIQRRNNVMCLVGWLDSIIHSESVVHPRWAHDDDATLFQCRNNVVCPMGWGSRKTRGSLLVSLEHIYLHLINVYLSNLYNYTTPHKLWAIFSNISRHLWSHRSQQCFILMVFYVILSDQGCIIRCFISFDFSLHLYCAARGFGISRAGDTFSILVKINYWNIHYFQAFSQRKIVIPVTKFILSKFVE